MRKRNVIAVFIAAAVLSVGLRLFEMLALTEYETGFIRPDKAGIFYAVSIVIAVLTVGSVIFALSNGPRAEKAASFVMARTVASLLLGIAVLFDSLTAQYSGVPIPLKYACIMFGYFTAAYFIAFSFRPFVHFAFSPKLSILPVLFFTLRAATVFIAHSSITVLSETVFDIGAYSFSMLFFLWFMRSVNNAAGNGNTKRLLVFGMLASLFSFCASLPPLVTYVINRDALHSVDNLSVLPVFTGLYISSVIFSRIAFVSKSERKMGVYYVGKH
ncbi:MAG: hypothetical protein IK086_06160 [Clostridia bacterium]|nr:hypothetical protein [Clostridia bacterium]